MGCGSAGAAGAGVGAGSGAGSASIAPTPVSEWTPPTGCSVALGRGSATAPPPVAEPDPSAASAVGGPRLGAAAERTARVGGLADRDPAPLRGVLLLDDGQHGERDRRERDGHDDAGGPNGLHGGEARRGR